MILQLTIYSVTIPLYQINILNFSDLLFSYWWKDIQWKKIIIKKNILLFLCSLEDGNISFPIIKNIAENKNFILIELNAEN